MLILSEYHTNYIFCDNVKVLSTVPFWIVQPSCITSNIFFFSFFFSFSEIYFNCLLHPCRIIWELIILLNADFYDPALHFASILHPTELLASRSVTIPPGLFAVWTVGLCFVRTDITYARINTAVIRDWTISGKKFNARFCDLQGGNVVTIDMNHFGPCFLWKAFFDL